VNEENRNKRSEGLQHYTRQLHVTTSGLKCVLKVEMCLQIGLNSFWLKVPPNENVKLSKSLSYSLLV